MINELKQSIAQRTGIPEEFLTGETPDELMDQADRLMQFAAGSRDKTTAEMFSDWFSGEAEKHLQASKKYVIPFDGKQDPEGDDPRPTWEQFADWLHNERGL